MLRLAAISPIGTGTRPRRASAARARTAQADFAVMTSKGCASLLCADAGPEEDGPLGAAFGADGADLRVVGAAEPELGPGLDRPRRAQADPRRRVRAPDVPVVACAEDADLEPAGAASGGRDRGRVRRHRRVPPALRQRTPLELGRRRNRLAGRRARRDPDPACSTSGAGAMTTVLTRPPIESLRPVVSFAVVRLILAVAALVGTAI